MRAYSKLTLAELKSLRAKIEDDPASHNSVGKYLFNSRASERLSHINALILYWPRQGKGKP